VTRRLQDAAEDQEDLKPPLDRGFVTASQRGERHNGCCDQEENRGREADIGSSRRRGSGTTDHIAAHLFDHGMSWGGSFLEDRRIKDSFGLVIPRLGMFFRNAT